MALPLRTVVYILGLLVCGSLNTITLKISLTMSSTDEAGKEKVFQKPWFMAFIMFVAMVAVLVFDKSIRRCEPCRLGGLSAGGKVPLIDTSPGRAQESKGGMHKLSWSKKVLLVGMPSVFDILATSLCNMGFLYIPASVWQLMRGAQLIFTAIFAVTCLGRKLYAFHLLGLVLCIAGIALVGLGSVWGDSSGSGSAAGSGSPGDIRTLFLGMALALAGQVVQAAQCVMEEWLLRDVDLPGLQVVGFEGVFGALIMLVFAFPLFYAIPGDDGGRFENEFDTLIMLQSSTSLLHMIMLYIISCATYNVAGMAVTGALSAVHRVMLEALRTCFVWTFGLTVHYCYDENSKFGEAWTPYSSLEVAGFMCLVLGQATYGAIIQVPGLFYPKVVDEQKIVVSPGAMQNLASPLPPAYVLEGAAATLEEETVEIEVEEDS